MFSISIAIVEKLFLQLKYHSRNDTTEELKEFLTLIELNLPFRLFFSPSATTSKKNEKEFYIRISNIEQKVLYMLEISDQKKAHYTIVKT